MSLKKNLTAEPQRTERKAGNIRGGLAIFRILGELRASAVNPVFLIFVSLAFFSCAASIRNSEAVRSDTNFRMLRPERAALLARDFAAGLTQNISGADENDLAVLYAKEAALGESEAHFIAAIQRSPELLEVFLNLGRLYYLCEEPELMKKVYSALAENPAIPGSVIHAAGVGIFQNFRSEEAVGIISALVYSTRPNLESALWLGNYYMNTAEYSSALRYYHRALELNSRSSEALFGLGHIAYLANDFARAAEYFKLAWNYGSREENLPYFTADSYFRLRLLPEAMDIIQKLPADKKSEIIAELQGKILLTMDYFADLSPILRPFPADAQSRLLRSWFGDADVKERTEILKEFINMY